MYSFFWFTDTYKILTGSSVEPVLSLASRIEALALPDKSKRATPKAPRQCKYIVCPLDNNRKSIEDIENVYNTPHEAFFVALFLTCRWICEIPIRQNQSVQKRLLPICMSTSPLPTEAFGIGNIRQRYEKYYNYYSFHWKKYSSPIYLRLYISGIFWKITTCDSYWKNILIATKDEKVVCSHFVVARSTK